MIMQDLKDLPSTGALYTDEDVRLYCAASFVCGAVLVVILVIGVLT